MTRGDTFPARLWFEVARNGEPLEVLAARMQVRDRVTGALYLAWTSQDGSIGLTGDPVVNAITLGEKSPEAMAAVPVGDHEYDLEVTLATGVVTLVKGVFPIRKDISHG